MRAAARSRRQRRGDDLGDGQGWTAQRTSQAQRQVGGQVAVPGIGRARDLHGRALGIGRQRRQRALADRAGPGALDRLAHGGAHGREVAEGRRIGHGRHSLRESAGYDLRLRPARMPGPDRLALQRAAGLTADAELGRTVEGPFVIILAFVVIGLVAGGVAQLVLKGTKRPIDWGEALVAGWVGSFVFGAIISLVVDGNLDIRISGLIGSTIGAIITLAVWYFIRDKVLKR